MKRLKINRFIASTDIPPSHNGKERTIGAVPYTVANKVAKSIINESRKWFHEAIKEVGFESEDERNNYLLDVLKEWDKHKRKYLRDHDYGTEVHDAFSLTNEKE